MHHLKMYIGIKGGLLWTPPLTILKRFILN